MWFNEYNAYESGTFELGQPVYHVKEVTHRFRFRKKCMYCDNTGMVLIKGKEFACPNCNGVFETKEVIERVVDEPDKIRSVLTLKNRKKSLEIYTNDPSGYGWIIQKQDDGKNFNFTTHAEAQAACDEYNNRNNVYLLIDEYKKRETKESL